MDCIKTFDSIISSKFQGWETLLFAKLARVMDCYPFVANISKKIRILRVVAFPEDAEVFQYTLEYLRRIIKKKADEALTIKQSIDGYKDRKESYDYKLSFCQGCVDRIVERIKEERDLRIQQSVQCRDLVVNKTAIVESYVSKLKV